MSRASTTSRRPPRGLSHERGRPRHAAPRSRRRWPLWAVPLALVVGVVAWIGVRGWLAKENLEEARALVGELRAEVAGFDLQSVEPTHRALAEHTAAARDLTGDPLWRAAEYVPWLGVNLTVVRELAEVTDDVVRSLDGAASLASTLDPAALAPQDGAIPLQPFVEAAPVVGELAPTFRSIADRAHAVDASGAVGPVARARDELVGLIDDTLPGIEAAGELVPLLPTLLGADGPRTFVVMFQNNAEARSLAGTALSFAVIQLDAGRIQLLETLPAGGGNFPHRTEPILPVPDGFDEVFHGAYGRFIANATTRPSSVSASAQVYEEWRQSRGVAADGVVSMDAVTLGYLLRATGPMQLSTGDVVDADTVVAFLLNSVLQRYDSGDVFADNVLQDAVYGEVVASMFGKLASGSFDVPSLAFSVMLAFNERRMTFWSAHEAEQAILLEAGLVHELPESDDAVDRVGLYLNDNVGSKLSYYLTTTLRTSSGMCGVDASQVHRLSLGLYSVLDPSLARSLSPSILGQYVREGLPPGVQRVLVFVYAPPGARFLRASVDGVEVELRPLHDRDHAVARLIALVDPSGVARIDVDIATGASHERDLEVEMTPLIVHPQRDERPLDCSTVPVG